jgi:tripartite-type tricarboxylate transporter receptor subunit TctC
MEEHGISGAIMDLESRSKTSLSRRTLMAQLLAAATMAPAGWTGATEAYPSQAVKILLGYSAGGASDAVARLLAQQLSVAFGRTFVVENRPGASATIAASAVAKAPADGHALLISTGPDSTIMPLVSKVPYAVPQDFAPVSLLTSVASVLVVRADSSYRGVEDVVKAAQAHPGRLNYGSYGSGSAAHMAAELFKSLTGTSITHVPYKGSSPAMTELLAGHLDLIFDTFFSATPQIKAGKLRALAVTTAKRVMSAPEVPTLQEAGLPGYEFQSFLGLSAPAHTPGPVVERLNRETVRIFSTAEVRQKMTELGMTAAPGTPEAYGAFLAAELARNRKLITEAKLTFDN